MGDPDIVSDQQESVFLQSVSLFISQFQKIWNTVKAFELQRTVKILHSIFLILEVMILAHHREAIEGIYTVEREAEETSRPLLSLLAQLAYYEIWIQNVKNIPWIILFAS